MPSIMKKNNLFKRLIFFIQIAIGILLIFFILFFITAKSFVNSLYMINLWFFFLAISCYFLNNILMIIRLKRVLAHLGQKLRFKFVFWAHMSGMILSDFTPLRSGYFYTAHALHKKGIPLEAGTAAITSTYVYDLLFKITVATVGLVYLYITILSPAMIISLVLAIVLVIVILSAYFIVLYPSTTVKRFMEGGRIRQNVLKIGKSGRDIQHLFPFILTISFIGWILRGLQWLFIGLSLHFVFSSFLDAFFLSPLLTLFSLIPLTPAGIGIQESAIIGFFSLIGIPAALSALFAFLVRGSEIIVDSIGSKEFFNKILHREDLISHYQTQEGDIDEKAFNSNILVQRYFQQRKTNMIRKYLENSKPDVLLDIGCGSGVQLRELQQVTGGISIGMDINRNVLRYARSRNLPNTEFIQADVHHLPIKSSSVRVIVCAEIIEHLPEPQMMLDEINRVLKPGGEVVITTPNECSIWGLYEFFWDVLGRGRDYGRTHLKFFTVRELQYHFGNFSTCSSETIFFLSPLFALFNNMTILDLGMRFDRFFERHGLGVSIIFYAKK